MSSRQIFVSEEEGWLDAGSQIKDPFSGIPKKYKKQRVISRGFYENSRLARVNQLNLNDFQIRSIQRGGVIFYTIINDELHMCFAKDDKTQELGDFGGGRRSNEGPVECSVREGNEESRYAFSEIKPDQVQDFFCLYNSSMMIIFIPVISPNEMDIRMITEQNFRNKQFLNKKQVKARCFNEITDLVWLNEAQINNVFSDRPSIQMFAKVRRFIYSCTEFSQSPSVMKNLLLIALRGDDFVEKPPAQISRIGYYNVKEGPPVRGKPAVDEDLLHAA